MLSKPAHNKVKHDRQQAGWTSVSVACAGPLLQALCIKFSNQKRTPYENNNQLARGKKICVYSI